GSGPVPDPFCGPALVPGNAAAGGAGLAVVSPLGLAKPPPVVAACHRRSADRGGWCPQDAVSALPRHGRRRKDGTLRIAPVARRIFVSFDLGRREPAGAY